MQIDWLGLLWQGALNAVGIFWHAIEQNPLVGLMLAGLAIVGLVAGPVRGRRRYRRS